MDMSQLHLTRPAPVRPQGFSEPVVLPATPIVFVVGEDVCVCSLLELLARHAGWQLETFAWAQDFLARRRPSAPSCLVLDMERCGVNGLDLQQRLADRPELPIIFCSGGGDVQTAVRAMKAGALEFLTKPLSGELLLSTMYDALHLSRVTLAQRAALDVLRVRYASLSSRECEVMAQVVCGRLNKQTAAELGISEITVKAHRGKMMRKMAARTVPDLVNMAAQLFRAA